MGNPAAPSLVEERRRRASSSQSVNERRGFYHAQISLLKRLQHSGAAAHAT